jgi:16S rRNA (uracil1498-N3)-methyltransferase
MAVCPTKNMERYEWFAEKATELGLDEIVPVIGDHSERKVFKPERLRRILLSAAKQSLKGAIPSVAEPLSVREFIAASSPDDLRLICCCFEGEVPRLSINDVLAGTRISVLIGPEGDFSHEEAKLAIEAGFIPVHLGPSRLRTETAALTAVEAVYLHFI